MSRDEEGRAKYRRFSVTQRLRFQRALADLNNYYLLRLDTNDPQEAGRLCDMLNASKIVEIAYVPAQAADPDPQSGECTDIPPVTPHWESSQNYRAAAPSGIDVAAAWAAGVRGRGDPDYWVVDVEQGWNVEHEDLDVNIDDVLNGPYNNEKRNHGTAVLGEIGACDNGFGMTGIVPDAQMKMVDWNLEPNLATAFDVATSHLAAGEIYLIEIQIFGPFDFLPVEWEQANFDAIQLHTSLGIVVVEAAGNGGEDLDDQSRYGQLFDRNFRDSGAIMVGAGASLNHGPLSFTNYGSRVDCQGYGHNVYTTGYGVLFGPDVDQYYTGGFNGTSSASPIVTGAAAATVLLQHELTGRNLTPAEVRALLSTFGTPQGPPTSDHIGVLPDLAQIINNLLPGLGKIADLDAASRMALAGSTFDMTGSVTNTLATTDNVDVWAEVIEAGENRPPTGTLIFGPVKLPLGTNETMDQPFTHTFGTTGHHIVTFYAGVFPIAVVSRAHIHVMVTTACADPSDPACGGS